MTVEYIAAKLEWLEKQIAELIDEAGGTAHINEIELSYDPDDKEESYRYRQLYLNAPVIAAGKIQGGSDIGDHVICPPCVLDVWDDKKKCWIKATVRKYKELPAELIEYRFEASDGIQINTFRKLSDAAINGAEARLRQCRLSPSISASCLEHTRKKIHTRKQPLSQQEQEAIMIRAVCGENTATMHRKDTDK